MKVVILQPGYIPWLGFFDLMYQSDIFVIFDDVQYTVRDWRSRNRIKTPDGVMWLTVPVKAKGVRDKLIKDVEIDNSQNWKMRHLKSYESFYRKAKYFNEIMTLIRNIYKINYTYLIDLDMDITIGFCEYMSLKSKIIFSSTIDINGKKDERLLAVCQYLNADKYLSGNAAKQYIREELFVNNGITLEWHNYVHPYYNQLWLKKNGFFSHLSIVDLLFNHGHESLDILTKKKLIAKPKGVQDRHANELDKTT